MTTTVSTLSPTVYSCLDAIQDIVAKLGGSHETCLAIASLGNSHPDAAVLEELKHRAGLISSKDAPLTIRIENECLVVRVGTATHAFCALAKNGGPLAENERIDDECQFARDVCDELSNEDESGASPLTKLLDTCMTHAVEQGSTAVRTLKRKARKLS